MTAREEQKTLVSQERRVTQGAPGAGGSGCRGAPGAGGLRAQGGSGLRGAPGSGGLRVRVGSRHRGTQGAGGLRVRVGSGHRGTQGAVGLRVRVGSGCGWAPGTGGLWVQVRCQWEPIAPSEGHPLAGRGGKGRGWGAGGERASPLRAGAVLTRGKWVTGNSSAHGPRTSKVTLSRARTPRPQSGRNAPGPAQAPVQQPVQGARSASSPEVNQDPEPGGGVPADTGPAASCLSQGLWSQGPRLKPHFSPAGVWLGASPLTLPRPRFPICNVARAAVPTSGGR